MPDHFACTRHIQFRCYRPLKLTSSCSKKSPVTEPTKWCGNVEKELNMCVVYQTRTITQCPPDVESLKHLNYTLWPFQIPMGTLSISEHYNRCMDVCARSLITQWQVARTCWPHATTVTMLPGERNHILPIVGLILSSHGHHLQHQAANSIAEIQPLFGTGMTFCGHVPDHDGAFQCATDADYCTHSCLFWHK